MNWDATMFVYLIAVALALLLGWLLRRNRLAAFGWVARLALVVFIGGGLIIADSMSAVSEAVRLRAWSQTGGTVIRSEVVGERALRPNIVYQYVAVNDTLIDSTSLDQAAFGGRGYRRQTAERISAEYPSGREVAVFFDPADPTDSTLRIHLYWAVYVRLSLGSLLCLFGLTWLIAFGLHRLEICRTR